MPAFTFRQSIVYEKQVPYARTRVIKTEKTRYMSYFGTKNADNPAVIGSYSSFFGATFVATDIYCRRLKKYCRRLKKYCRRLEKYCRRLKKYERRLEKYERRLEKYERYFPVAKVSLSTSAL